MAPSWLQYSLSNPSFILVRGILSIEPFSSPFTKTLRSFGGRGKLYILSLITRSGEGFAIFTRQ